MAVVFLFILSSLTGCSATSFQLQVSHDAVDELASHLNPIIQERIIANRIIYPQLEYTGPLGFRTIKIGPTISLESISMGDLIITLGATTQKFQIEVPNLHMSFTPMTVSTEKFRPTLRDDCSGTLAVGAANYFASFSVTLKVDDCGLSVGSVEDVVIDPDEGTTIIDISDTTPRLCEIFAEGAETFTTIFNEFVGFIVSRMGPNLAATVLATNLDLKIDRNHELINELVTVCFTEMTILSDHLYITTDFSMGTSASSNETTPSYAALVALDDDETGLVIAAVLFIVGGLILGCACGSCLHWWRKRD